MFFLVRVARRLPEFRLNAEHCRLESEGSKGSVLVPQRPVAVVAGYLNLVAGKIVRIM